jgi:hypothetical protein
MFTGNIRDLGSQNMLRATVTKTMQDRRDSVWENGAAKLSCHVTWTMKSASLATDEAILNVFIGSGQLVGTETFPGVPAEIPLHDRYFISTYDSRTRTNYYHHTIVVPDDDMSKGGGPCVASTDITLYIPIAREGSISRDAAITFQSAFTTLNEDGRRTASRRQAKCAILVYELDKLGPGKEVSGILVQRVFRDGLPDEVVCGEVKLSNIELSIRTRDRGQDGIVFSTVDDRSRTICVGRNGTQRLNFVRETRSERKWFDEREATRGLEAESRLRMPTVDGIPAYIYLLRPPPRTLTERFWINAMYSVVRQQYPDRDDTCLIHNIEDGSMPLDQVVSVFGGMLTLCTDYCDYIGDFVADGMRLVPSECFDDIARAMAGDCEDSANFIHRMFKGFMAMQFSNSALVDIKRRLVDADMSMILMLMLVGSPRAQSNENNDEGMAGHMCAMMFAGNDLCLILEGTSWTRADGKPDRYSRANARLALSTRDPVFSSIWNVGESPTTGTGTLNFGPNSTMLHFSHDSDNSFYRAPLAMIGTELINNGVGEAVCCTKNTSGGFDYGVEFGHFVRANRTGISSPSDPDMRYFVSYDIEARDIRKCYDASGTQLPLSTVEYDDGDATVPTIVAMFERVKTACKGRESPDGEEFVGFATRRVRDYMLTDDFCKSMLVLVERNPSIISFTYHREHVFRLRSGYLLVFGISD